MRLQIRPIKVEMGKLVYARDAKYSDAIEPVLKDALYAVTETRWQIETGDASLATPSMEEQRQAKAEEAKAAMREHPMVKAVEAAFPDAEMIEDGADVPPMRREVPWNRRA